MIVTKMFPIVKSARWVYTKEAVDYITVYIDNDNYVRVESTGIDSEFTDQWGSEKILPIEREQALKIIRWINFGRENVRYLDNGVEVYVKRSPKMLQIEDSIYALRRASFYKELHQEESCVYSCILKNTKKAEKELREFLKEYPNVECHYEYGIYKLYM